MEGENDRPAKRQKITNTSEVLSEDKSSVKDESLSGSSQPHSKSKSRKPAYSSQKRNGASNEKHNVKKQATNRTFSQPSVITPGDKGIFVTCDKGKEKNCLLELHDLVLQDLESNRSILNDPKDESDEGEPQQLDSIEADIAAELSSLKGDVSKSGSGSEAKPFQLITLDIPCVSFLRFPPGSALDPVEMVHRICLNAADRNSAQQSRYIKRLTPLCSLRKVLSQGLEKACEEVLRPIFGPDETGSVKSVKFAIRPTVRNNEKIDRDEIIKTVADRVQDIGQKSHTVDLKQYEKGIIVEVYRGWVGMSVIDNIGGLVFYSGFEQLKRFNLAEIYSSR